MSYSPYWVICLAAQVDQARQHAETLGWTSEFTVQLSPTGEMPATHYAGHGQLVKDGDAVGTKSWLEAYIDQNNLAVEFIDSDLANPKAALLQAKGLQVIVIEDEAPRR